MNFESRDPFNFNIPEKRLSSFTHKTIVLILALLFLVVPLWSIDKHVFKTNEVWIIDNCNHELCKEDLDCIFISY